jgi:hypothetical protein
MVMVKIVDMVVISHPIHQCLVVMATVTHTVVLMIRLVLVMTNQHLRTIPQGRMEPLGNP